MVGLLAPSTALGGVTRVRDGASFTTLTAAFAGGAGTIDGDVLELDPGTLTEGAPVTVSASVTITGSGSTLKSSTGNTILTIGGGKTLTLTDLSVVGTGAGQRAITSISGSLVATDVTFDTTYTGDQGGAINLASPGSVALTRVTFPGTVGVELATNGGALWVDGNGATPVTLTDVTFIDTEASDNGGAIHATGVALTCDGCVFDGGAASTGGGIYSIDSTLTVRRSRFCAVGAANGGAIHGDLQSSGTLENNIFGQNLATGGGALFAEGGAWTITNNHLIGNTGLGAIQSGAAGVTFTARNNLFLDNADFGISLAVTGAPTVAYNWFDGNGGTLNNGGVLAGTNETTGGDPDLAGVSTNCLTGELWPSPVTSGLLDAGDPGAAYEDLDGTPNDIGAYGGPAAGPGVTAADDVYLDSDADGEPYLHDCDDADGANYPGNAEVCDGGDNDCDALSDDADPGVTDQQLWLHDCDFDGVGTYLIVEQCFLPVGPCGYVAQGDPHDCDDTDPDILGPTEWYDDNDGDGLGDARASLFSCAAPAGFVDVSGDCDDNDETVLGALVGYVDADEDGYGVEPQVGYCEGEPGYAETSGDCADDEPTAYPGGEEVCDGIDSNCVDGIEDESRSTYYLDSDGDGYGDASMSEWLCGPTAGWVTDRTDCDDLHANAHPGGTQECNGLDGDCDGVSDGEGPLGLWYADADGDGQGDAATETITACPPTGWVKDGSDCDDHDASRGLGFPELADDGVDQDCDGVDNGVAAASCNCRSTPAGGGGLWVGLV
ncbi:MAG: MopE-related protein, partial [Myxococcota bacterium]